ncbi:MAG: hypothetical protein WCJ98_00030 [Mycobacteriaceae bacterium]
MSPSDSTRPISVAELLARNGTIGSPPVSGRRHRRRGNDQSVTVAELTGEIPVIRVEEPVAEPEAAEEPVAEEPASAETVVVYADETDETVVVYADETDETDETDDADDADYTDETDYTDHVDYTEPAPVAGFPPLSSAPLPSRERGLELSHDPRPQRRSSGAEQMTYDPVDQSVDLVGLVDDQAEVAEELRSYLRSSGGTLFSGETVADDLARRGVIEVDDDLPGAGLVTATPARPREAPLTALRHGLVAVAQSVLAVVFGAGLFLGFDQLWRWNNIVALVLSVLVILGLVVAVRAVRKTEDIASTLIAVAVGALVTLGPLALLQST